MWSWVVDGRSIARSIKTCGLPKSNSILQIKDTVENWECPQCNFRVDNCNVSNEWPGLPVGVKFDPSDVELLEHLAAKNGVGNQKTHQYIDEFIPTLDVEEGICCKHPEDLPGSRKDGNSFHFFYRTTNAYTTGQRKRRKISAESSVRWHKTGKTKSILKNGVHIGFKKILVLNKTSNKGTKPCILNWVMHQYHLGTNEDEKDGEYVVSKIFFQAQKQQVENHANVVAGVEELDDVCNSPRTPLTNADPPRPVKTPLYEDDVNDYQVGSYIYCFTTEIQILFYNSR
ncbi:SUPPRESSOR OF GAMMA RESPONSE 1-like [Rutidosis leptorrhynchoides]|uniref:SUPPRESSOR OF GAMMA RESPONSE 1-like n=1 Tax=Rutidosis leptorrhynchoides TaxID=125765 RepID=UPI003A99E140